MDNSIMHPAERLQAITTQWTPAEYHEKPWLSSSMLKKMLTDPENWNKTEAPPKTRQRAFDFGHAVEAAWCFEESPDGPDAALVQFAVQQLNSHPIASKLHADSVFQQPIVFPSYSYHQEGHTGVLLCKALLDGWDEIRGIAWDIKTSRNPDPDGFRKDAANLGYDLQAEHYSLAIEEVTGCRPRYWLWVVVGNYDSKTPGKVWVYEADSEWLDIGRRKALEAFAVYYRGVTTGVFERYDSSQIQALRPPRWARYF